MFVQWGELHSMYARSMCVHAHACMPMRACLIDMRAYDLPCLTWHCSHRKRHTHEAIHDLGVPACPQTYTYSIRPMRDEQQQQQAECTDKSSSLGNTANG